MNIPNSPMRNVVVSETMPVFTPQGKVVQLAEVKKLNSTDSFIRNLQHKSFLTKLKNLIKIR